MLRLQPLQQFSGPRLALNVSFEGPGECDPSEASSELLCESLGAQAQFEALLRLLSSAAPGFEFS